MSTRFNIHMFSHSLVSDWNHGNAHFLRGLAQALTRMGHKVRCHEELGSWSLSNLVQSENDRSIEAIDQFRRTYPELDIHFYRRDSGLQPYLEKELRHAEVVIIHEWNEPQVVNAVLAMKQKYGFIALFHDTHHRAYSNPGQLLRLHLHLFDGVLAFGEPLRQIYQNGFGMRNVWVFHEAADVETFQPIPLEKQVDALWIGNWGDEERTQELREFLLGPAKAEPRLRFVAHGVRYPQEALEALADSNIEYLGYLPNLKAPEAYSGSKVALHIPRKQYANGLSGVPTIRVFEALACGAALVCSPWKDVEGLFRANEDFLCVQSGEEMRQIIAELASDDGARLQLANNGLETIRKRHTCAHRAAELTEICEELTA